MRSTKRTRKSSYTPTPSKKIKQSLQAVQQRVYYSDSFDLFNFSDSQFLQNLASYFPNTYLIIGIEDSPSCVYSIEEQEESLKRTGFVRQVLYPAPKVSKDFISSFSIDYIFTSNQTLYSDLDIENKLIAVDRPARLTSDELISRVLLNKSQFLSKCFSKGFSRQQLGVSLLQELKVKYFRFPIFQRWVLSRPSAKKHGKETRLEEEVKEMNN